MKLTLLTFGLVVIAAANPIDDELLPRAAQCTSGIVDPNNGPCSYNVSCGYRQTTYPGSKPLANKKVKSLNNCLTTCTNFVKDDENCGSVNYEIATGKCTLFSAPVFYSKAVNSGYDAAFIYGCG